MVKVFVEIPHQGCYTDMQIAEYVHEDAAGWYVVNSSGDLVITQGAPPEIVPVAQYAGGTWKYVRSD